MDLTNISTGIKCSNELILDNLGVLFDVVAINNLFTVFFIVSFYGE